MKISLKVGDITAEEVDAIVNAANSTLLGGGGVDGAIHKAAGPELLAECQDIRSRMFPTGLPTGEAVATGAGKLNAKWVIHTVGPNRNAGQTDVADLESCFSASLDLAQRLNVSSIAFPAIGAGVYGWDAADVARAARKVIIDSQSAAQRWSNVGDIRFVLFSDAVFDAFHRVFEKH
ncbi:O-acetyl-ADP-ribose deacetylase [Micrococcoides hystricis]|uniref:O-acetyl-ADP-ribose deacetylase n=1 Tax=Micrococcoides hystricis TaxID=1572761 RepID=A0ABV6P750_9MICC